MTTQTPASRPAALWAAAFPVGLVLLLLGMRDEGTLGTVLIVGAVASFVVAAAAVAAARGGRRATERG